MWWLFLGFALILGCLSLIVLGREFRQTLTSGRPAYIVTLFLVPLLGLGLYYFIGASQDVRIYDRMQQLLAQSASGDEPSADQREALMESIRRRAEQIDSVDYWYLIANQYMGEGNYNRAVESFERASAIAPEDTAIKAELAQAMFLASGNRLTPEVQELITEVRALNPENVTINGLLGIAAFQVEQWQMAINYWELAMAGLPPASREAQAIGSSIEAARSMLGEDDMDQVESSVAIQVDVSLDPGVEVDPQTTVFVFARASEGPAMPLAVERLTVADLPAQV